MCEALGYEVFKLRRVRIMNISLDGIPNGQWRYLSDNEVAEILAMCEDSSSTEEASKMDAKGKRIRRATDAKLFDSRDENQESKARRNQKQRTFKGRNADEFRHAPNSKKGKDKSGSTGKTSGNKFKPAYRSDKPSENPSNKPRKGGTLGLKK
jgi:23S rRNA pseudouridine2604 synthase